MLDHLTVLNFAAKYLSRRPDAPLAEYAEAWRFPLVDSHRLVNLSKVTFVWVASSLDDQRPVSVLGTFANLHEPIPLEIVLSGDQPTRYRALTVEIPKGEVHTYKFSVGGVPMIDPINPQRTVLDNGFEWSRFFTPGCTIPLSFEGWEIEILTRLTNHILPFRSRDAQRFVDLYYRNADRQARLAGFPHVFRLEQPMGVVNFIDKLVAREERHRLIDYKVCLRILDKILRQRHPGLAPQQAPLQTYEDLYNEMASGNVSGWDTSEYGNPNFFLQLLRRHTYTGAFSHPKYGGNASAAAWAYIEEMLGDAKGNSCFDWRQAIEPPLGTSGDYLG